MNWEERRDWDLIWRSALSSGRLKPEPVRTGGRTKQLWNRQKWGVAVSLMIFFFQSQPGLLPGIPKNGCSHLSLGNCQGLDTWREGWYCGVGRMKQYAWTHGVSRQFVLAEERSEANSKMEKEAEGGVWQRWECGSSGTLGHQKRTWGVEEEEGWSWSLREKCWTGTGSLILDALSLVDDGEVLDWDWVLDP